MISVTENIAKLTWQENQLHTSLDNLRGQRSKVKEHKQLAQELSRVVSKRQNLQDWAIFELGMPVHRLNSPLLGIVEQLKITPGGMGEVWVSWDGLLQIPEQPNMLQIDGAAMAKIIAVGDRVEIVEGHEESGKIFTVERLLARGAVETSDENIFEREKWQKVEQADQKLVQTRSEDDEYLIHSSSFSQEPQMVTEPTEELGSKTSETTITVNTIATQIEELTEEEEKERHRLELKVERAFVEAGTSLRELRDKRLYRSTHTTFETYCRDRFGFTRANATYLITGASVVDNLKKMSTNGLQILPSNERQTRPLTKLEPNEQRQIWQQAVEEAGGKVPTGRIVQGIVQRLKEKPLVKASDFCAVGDAFILTRLEGAERKYNGCWAIARELRDFTIAVDVYDNTLTVKPDNLDPIDLPDVRRQLPQTLKRIRRLRETGLLSRCVYTILESIGRQTYLDDFEAELLSFMEQRYGIEN
ncbi:hypothetical protein [Chlorogloea sp. CCALA 695]|uniref:hypothetical protein n=1 Tax=Chlorogloea sp. CCALA 695 TaxID=2107693 RepID=UPI000D04CFC7|nr:hypothetical protein [Chlorogloea sp. CCALA 695]PSB28356.1 hypothetical protein C7B70_21105 [Chlorogloea sp. CCALA 695]